MTVTRETLIRYTFKSVGVNVLILGKLQKNLQILCLGLPRSRQPPHQLLLFLQQIPQFLGGRVGLDASLYIGKLFFSLPVTQRLQATLRFLPVWLAGFLKQDFVEQPTVALLQSRGNLGCLHRLAGKAGDNQRAKYLLSFQSVVELTQLKLLCQFLAKAFPVGQHTNQPALDRLCSAPYQLRLGLDLAVTL